MVKALIGCAAALALALAVITGYALTFASLLIIGGRLGDVFGHRRIFVIGAALFGGGSLLAALSWGIPSLIVGEALIALERATAGGFCAGFGTASANHP